jgi:ribonuclease BN (tRNA processing enzyme)
MADSVTFLGTSDGLPSTNRRHASLLVRMAGRTILLDCGEPCAHTLKRMGVDFNSIDALVITHTHSDHVGGFPMLAQSMWLERRRRPLPVWIPRHAIRPLQNWLHACYLFDSLLPFRIQWRPLSERSVMRCGSVRMQAFRTSHLLKLQQHFARRYPAVEFNAYSVRLSAGDKRLGYSADLGSHHDLDPLCDQPLDLLVVELAHVHPRKLFAFLRERTVRRAAITHVGRPMLARLDEIKAAAQFLKPKKVSFVRDDDVVRF